MFLTVQSAGEHLGQRATKMPFESLRFSRVSEHLGQVGRPVPGRFVLECSLTCARVLLPSLDLHVAAVLYR